MTPKVIIRHPGPDDAAGFLAAVGRSRRLHGQWVAPPATPSAYDNYLERISCDTHYGFLVVCRTTQDLVGVINLNEIIRGSFRNAFLGYYAFSGQTGRGLMEAGLRLVIRHAFGKLKLHRIEANIQPRNTASLDLVRRCGFVCEGFSRRYLKIGGRWRDHERWALLAENFPASSPPGEG